MQSLGSAAMEVSCKKSRLPIGSREVRLEFRGVLMRAKAPIGHMSRQAFFVVGAL